MSHFKLQMEQLENLELETVRLLCLLYDTPIFLPIRVLERSIFRTFYVPEKLSAIPKHFVASARNKLKLRLPQGIQNSSWFSHKIFACPPSCASLLLVSWLWQWNGSSPSVSKRTFIFSDKPFHVVSSATSNVMKCSLISMSRLDAYTWGDPKKTRFFHERLIYLKNYKKFISHLQSTLHWMICTYPISVSTVRYISCTYPISVSTVRYISGTLQGGCCSALLLKLR